MNAPAHRAGAVAIIGRPNVGKSTLLNRLVGQKISITSRKPQTTRHRIIGIVTREHAQLAMLDTPGFQTRHGGTLHRSMNRVVSRALAEADVILWVVEALRFNEEDKKLLALLPQSATVVLAINKIDRVADKPALLPFIAQMQALHPYAAIVPVAASKGQGVEDLVDAIAQHLPEQPALYGEDEITESNERFLAAELIREKVFRLLGEELPYASAVVIEQFEEEGNLRRIHAAIIVDKDSHKGMVVGKGGAKLKEIATQARIDMEKLFGGKVFLEVWVKVKNGWSENAGFLKQLGHE